MLWAPKKNVPKIEKLCTFQLFNEIGNKLFRIKAFGISL